ncbi:MAG TPA: O-antigen ligase family protein, partial [Chthoniobacteraceae bacterium]|nr:O-antigen ligase family protein [Chthoniobacteraceae bacterium]
KYRMYLAGVLLAIALGQVIVGLFQFAKHPDYMLFGYEEGDASNPNYIFKIFLGIHRFPSGNRASGQYISPNHFAGYLEVVGIIGLSLVFWSTWKPVTKILAIWATVPAFLGVLISGSRGGYLSTLFCLVVFCALGLTAIKVAYPERMVRVVLIGGAVVLLLGGALSFFIMSSTSVKNRAGNIIDEKNMRLGMWHAALEQTALQPVAGTGSGTYLYYGRKFREPGLREDPIRVHNDYLDLLAEYGVLGVAGFLVFLVLHLWNGMHTFFWLLCKRLQFSADWRSSSLALNIGCLCAVAAYLVHSIFDFNLHIPANALLMAFVFGILANPGLETSHETKATAKTSRAFQFLLPALGLFLLVLALARLPGEWYAEKARVALRDGQFLDSTAAARDGLRWDKGNPYLYYYGGEAQRHMGDLFPIPAMARPYYEAASDQFKKGIALFPEDENLLVIEGWTLDTIGEHDEAGKYFQQALDWDPNSEDVQQYEFTHTEILKQSDSPGPGQ